MLPPPALSLFSQQCTQYGHGPPSSDCPPVAVPASAAQRAGIVSSTMDESDDVKVSLSANLTLAVAGNTGWWEQPLVGLSQQNHSQHQQAQPQSPSLHGYRGPTAPGSPLLQSGLVINTDTGSHGPNTPSSSQPQTPSSSGTAALTLSPGLSSSRDVSPLTPPMHAHLVGKSQSLPGSPLRKGESGPVRERERERGVPIPNQYGRQGKRNSFSGAVGVGSVSSTGSGSLWSHTSDSNMSSRKSSICSGTLTGSSSPEISLGPLSPPDEVSATVTARPLVMSSNLTRLQHRLPKEAAKARLSQNARKYGTR